MGFWGTVVLVGLAVPVAAFRESFHHNPVQQPDGSWIWSYSVNVGTFVYSAELHGQFIPEGVHWAMNISKDGGYIDVQYTKDVPYDYICDIYNKSEDNHTYIE